MKSRKENQPDRDKHIGDKGTYKRCVWQKRRRRRQQQQPVHWDLLHTVEEERAVE